MFVVRTQSVLKIVRTQAMPGSFGRPRLPFRIDAGPKFYLSEVAEPFEGPVLICSGRQEPAGYQRQCALWPALRAES